jgi:diguanylate cyclase (GGDEF)-like protein
LIITVVIFYYGFNKKTNEIYLEESLAKHDQVTLNSKLFLEHQIIEQSNLLRNIEISIHENEYSVDKTLSIFTNHLAANEHLAILEYINNDGIVLISTNQDASREGFQLNENHFSNQITEIHQFVIGGIKYNLSMDALALEVAFSSEEGIILGYLDISFFEEYGSELASSFNTLELKIYQEDGIVIFDSANDLHLLRFRSLLYEDVKEAYISKSPFMVINNKEAIISVEKIADTDWYLLSYEYTDDAFSLKDETQKTIGITIVGIITVFVIGYLLTETLIISEFSDIASRLTMFSDNYQRKPFKESIFKQVDSVRRNLDSMTYELLKNKDELELLAYNNSLTGLPSKQKAIIDFDECKNKRENIFFLYMDLKRFSIFNMNFGFSEGDKILIDIASRLGKLDLYVYHIEADEFLVMLPDATRQDVKIIKNKIRLLLSNELQYGNDYLQIDVNIGIAQYPDNGKSFNELLNCSVIAMREAKDNMTSYYVDYDNSKTPLYKRSSEIELHLKDAIKNDWFDIVLQPIVDVENLSIRGFEVLSRLDSKEFGKVSPDEFIPILEKTHLIYQLDFSVLKKAIMNVKLLQDKYDIDFILSVNFSVETIMRAEFLSKVINTIESLDFKPYHLEIEITESSFIYDFESIKSKMTYLKNKGVLFSEDDFGEGYSSLTYLTKLDLDTLKISKNFLTSIHNHAKNKYLVQSVLELAKKLGFKTIVEGVEDEKTYLLFKKYGCNYIQGYYFYKPLEYSKLDDVLKRLYKGNDNYEE